MTRPPIITLQDRHRFDTIIDARSEAEYALDHIPGAINCPVLNNEQRIIVGTLYKQTGAFEARRVGGAMVAENLSIYLRTLFADKPAKWRPLVYCWRGGMRSGSMTTWWRLVGWDAQQLPGGYKTWRRHVIDCITERAPQLQLRVVCGATGSAKTRVLQALANMGEQVLDLEGIAVHKGSILGAVPGQAQPSQKAFETQLVARLEKFDLKRPIFIEAESKKIGRLTVPEQLLARLRASNCIEVDATPAARLAFLLRDYAYLGNVPSALAQTLSVLKDLHGKESLSRWQAWAMARDLEPLFEELMGLHYDPLYSRSQSRNFVHWASRVSVPCDDLTEGGIQSLATKVLAACG